MEEVKIDFRYSKLKRHDWDDGEFVLSKGPLVLDVQIGDMKKQVEYSPISFRYIDDPELLYWGIYKVADNYLELKDLRKHMVENGDYYLNGEKIMLTEEQIEDFTTREKEEKQTVKRTGIFTLLSIFGMSYIGYQFWGVSKWLLLILTLFEIISLAKNRTWISVLTMPFKVIVGFLLLPLSIISSVSLFVVLVLFSGELKGGFRGLFEAKRGNK